MGRGIDRARDDVAVGELWRARDRLRGVLQNDPANQQALDLLGEVYWQMGDLPQAGRFWWLPAVRARLAELQGEATRAGVEWGPREAIRRPRGSRDPETGGWKGEAIALVVVAAVVGVWVVGFVVVLAFLISLTF